MPRYVLIMAGGRGTRMKMDIPKQFLLLDGRPIILHTIDRFLEYDSEIEIVLVLPENYMDQWEDICRKYKCSFKHRVAPGGDERFYSVKNGLKATGPDGLIAIHDAVRPLVSQSTIRACFEMAESMGNAVPVVSAPESVRETDAAGRGNRPLDRDMVKMVQTPQVFSSDLVHKAYDCGFSPHFTDDATVVERLGITINLVEGNRENIKITRPQDLVLAGALIKEITKK